MEFPDKPSQRQEMHFMNRFLTPVLGLVCIASLVSLIALTAIGFAIFTQAQTPYNWMNQMWSGSGTTNGGMGGMMGQTGQTSASINPLLPYFGVIFAVLIGVTVIGIVGLGYYLLYPQMRISAMQPAAASEKIAQKTSSSTLPYESVSKTLTEEERKIIEVLNNHNGKYLQKYIRNETGLSRLQTHRIIARLADRGIVSLEKTGNTNQVIMASWLQNQ
jgi:predicted transcriptional regulator